MKKLFTAIAVLFFGFAAFAQNAPKTGITDNDVQNFAKNYKTIEKEMDKLGNWKNNTAGDLKDLAKAEAVLEANGISGPDRVKKVGMIGICYALAVGEEEMGSLDADTLALLKSMGKKDPFETLRVQSNADDYKVVQRNLKILKKYVKD